MSSDRRRGGPHLTQIGLAVGKRRRPRAEKHDVAAGYAVGVIRREAEAARVEIATQHLWQPDLVDRTITAIEALDTGRVDIQPDDLMSELRKRDCVAETDIAAATDHTDRLHSHRSSSSSSPGAAAFTETDVSCAVASNA